MNPDVVRAVPAFADRFGTEPEGVWAARAASTSSASTPTTTTASCSRSPCRRPPAPRSPGVATDRWPSPRCRATADRGARLDELAPGRPGGWAAYPAGVVDGAEDRLAGGVRSGRLRRPRRGRPVLLGRADLLGRAGPARSPLPRNSAVGPGRAGPPVGERVRRRADRHPRPVGLAAVHGRATPCSSTPGTAHRARAAGPSGRRARTARRRHRRPHTHADGGYGDRRGECEAAAARLGVPARGTSPTSRASRPWPTTTSCCGARGTSSPRTRGSCRWSAMLRGAGDPRRDRSGADRRPRLAPRRLRDLHGRTGRVRGRALDAGADGAPHGRAAGSAAARWCWSTPIGSTPSPPPSSSRFAAEGYMRTSHVRRRSLRGGPAAGLTSARGAGDRRGGVEHRTDDLGAGRRPSRSTGPETETAPSTAPEPSRTGADSDATPGSRSAMLCAQPRRRTSSSVRAVKLAEGSRRVTSSAGVKASSAWAAEPAVIGSRRPTGTVSRSPLVRSAAATQTRVAPSRT